MRSRVRGLLSSTCLLGACCGPGDKDSGGNPSTNALFSADPVAVTDAACPLVPTITATSATPVTMTVTVGDQTRATSTPSTSPSLPMYDFVPGVPYTFSVSLASDGATETRTVDWTPPPLPDAWPLAENLVDPPDVANMQPGYTFLPLTWLGHANYIAAVDENGAPHWLYSANSRVDDLDLDLDGNPLFLDDGGLHRLDWSCHEFGRYVWDPPPPGAPSDAIAIPGTLLFHHEVSQLADGTFLTLDHEVHRGVELPSDYSLTATAPTDVDSAVILRFDASGAVLDRISYFDLFQTNRIGYDALNESTEVPGTVDWVHGNAVQWDEWDDSYVASARQQDAVMKFHRDIDQSLQIDWILATPANWSAPWTDSLLTRDAATQWQYHQHAPVLSEDGSLVLFDNGNQRVSPPDPIPPNYKPVSRAVQFHVDADAMTVSTDWVHASTGDGQVDCTANGSVTHLENGDVLMLCAYGANRGMALNTDLGHGRHTVRLIEFDPATGTNRWDLELYSDISEDDDGWSSARARRIAAIAAP
jgi:hypothetical protein